VRAVARVNRVFRDKPGGLLVDYIGIGEDLRASLRAYDEKGDRRARHPRRAAPLASLWEKYEVLCVRSPCVIASLNAVAHPAPLLASTAQADRPARLRDVDDLAALGDLDLAVGHKLGGGGAGRVHKRAEVLAG